MALEDQSPSKFLTVRDAVEDFLLVKQLCNLSPLTLDWYKHKLQTLLRDFLDSPLGEVSIRDVRQKLAVLADGRTPSTLNAYIRSLKCFLNWAADEELQVGVNLRRLRQVKTESRMAPALSPEQIRALLEQPGGGWIGDRDKTAMMLMLDTAVRVSECIGIKTDDVDVSAGLVLIRADNSKSRRDRTLALSLPMRLQMRRWLRRRTTVSRRNGWEEAVWLFPNRSAGQLSRSTVYQRVKAYGQAAGIEGVRVSPHTLRSTFATEFCRAGGGLIHLQLALGPSGIEQSRKYVAAVDRDAWEASRAFSPIARMR